MSSTGGFNRTLKIGISVADVLIYHLAFLISFYIRYRGTLPTLNFSAYQEAVSYIMIIFVLVNIFSGIYTLYNKRIIDIFSITLITQLVMSISIMAMTFFGRWFAFPRTIIFIVFFVSSVLLFIWRILVLKIYQKKAGISKIMVIGSKEQCEEAIRNFKISHSEQYRVTAATVDNYFENIQENIDQIDIFYILDSSILNEELDIVSYLTFKNKRIFLSTGFENIIRINNRIMNIDDESLIAVSKIEISPENGTVKRIVDIVVAILAIILTSPIMLITAFLIKITSKGPIFYKQVRITKNQKEFNIIKFRTMRTDAEDLSGPVLAQADDPRITKIGKKLRSLRIDELPQLFNVLKGDMALVGPRPERPYFVEKFKEENPYYYLRHNVRAGITGYAQVYGKYSTGFNSKLKFDLLYIKNYSFILDIQILFQTLKILFDKVSSQGVEEELTTATIFKDVTIYK